MQRPGKILFLGLFCIRFSSRLLVCDKFLNELLFSVGIPVEKMYHFVVLIFFFIHFSYQEKKSVCK